VLKLLEERIERAISLHDKGYNCAQSVVCAYCDVLGLDEKTGFRIAEGFGAGMGNFQGTCGALTGAFMLAGLATDGSGMNGLKTKQDTYRRVKALTEEFRNMNGSVICSELKGLNGGPVLRSCKGCVADSAKIIGEFLIKEGYAI